MKKLVSLGFPLCLCLMFLLSSYSLQDDPNGKAGASGAPGETTCNATDCHNSFAVNSGTGSVTISSPNLTDWAYVPGTTYTISVTVAQSSINLFGLCFEALKPNGDNAGTLHAGTGTQIKNKTIGGFQRKSITHNDNTGATANTHTFTFTWDAPATDIGNITFYVAGLAANANGTEIGDRVYSTSQVVTAATVGLDEIASSKEAVLLYPNPAQHNLTFSTSELSTLVYEIIIIDLSGKTVLSLKKSDWQISGNNATIDIESLTAGQYTLCFAANGRAISSASFHKIK